MPYRRSYRRYPKKRYASPMYKKPSLIQTKRLIRSEIRRNDRKDHPLQWHDIKWTGQYVSTTPLLISFGETLRNFFNDNALYNLWPIREIRGTTDTYRQANVYITGFAYQFRYQQNEQATTTVTTSTVRTLMYSLDDDYAENPGALLAGGDIDLPPLTSDVTTMYYDKLHTLKAGYTEGETDDTEFVPGQSIVKGFKKLNRKFVYQTGEGVSHEEGGDIRVEHQSDDNSTIGEVQLYGFIRIYYRIAD